MKIRKNQLIWALDVINNTKTKGRAARGLARLLALIASEQSIYEKEQIAIYTEHGCTVNDDGGITYPEDFTQITELNNDIADLNGDVITFDLTTITEYVDPIYNALLDDVEPLDSSLISMYDYILTELEKLTENKEEETNE